MAVLKSFGQGVCSATDSAPVGILAGVAIIVVGSLFLVMQKQEEDNKGKSEDVIADMRTEHAKMRYANGSLLILMGILMAIWALCGILPQGEYKPVA